MHDLPKIALARLRDTASEHPDPDLIAAFVEGNLLRAERASLLDHLSRCSACREVVEMAAPEAIPQLVVLPRPALAWLRFPALRWGTLAACIALLVGALVLRQRSQSPRMEIAMQSAPPPATVQEITPKSREKAIQPASPGPRKKSDTVSTPSEPLNHEPADNLASVPRTDAKSANLAKRKEEVASLAQPAAESQLEAKADAAAPARAGAATNGPVFTARPSTETAASTIGGAKLADLQAPSWRLSDDGLPERSFNSGPWEKVKVDHMQGFRAVASREMEVWIGGAAGALYHSQDMGLHWARIIPAASGSSLSDDITGLTFPDHDHVNLTTATGAKWITSDAGQTWHTE
jgi:Photosynthesis system II assembly factor YCF48